MLEPARVFVREQQRRIGGAKKMACCTRPPAVPSLKRSGCCHQICKGHALPTITEAPHMRKSFRHTNCQLTTLILRVQG